MNSLVKYSVQLILILPCSLGVYIYKCVGDLHISDTTALCMYVCILNKRDACSGASKRAERSLSLSEIEADPWREEMEEKNRKISSTRGERRETHSSITEASEEKQERRKKRAFIRFFEEV